MSCNNTPISHSIDTGYQRHVGYDATVQGNLNLQNLFAPERLAVYQQKITQLLEGVEPTGRLIVVPLETIGSVLSQCYESNKPKVGDIFSRYIQQDIEAGRNDVRDIVDRAITIIVGQIKNEYETIENNKKLSVWNALLGDFSKEGLRAHPPIKLNRKRGKLLFMTNY